MDLSDEFYLRTGYEPKAYDFEETSVEPYTDSPPFLFDKGFPADAEYDDAALEGMLREAHRVHSHRSQREDLSVSLSSSVSDRTGRPVGDRAGRPAEQSSQEAQIWTLLDKQKEQILAECQARINRHEFQGAYDRRSFTKIGVKLLNLNEKNFIALDLKKFNREINSFFKDSYCSKIWNYVKLTKEVSQKWKS